ncbi:MAG: right-handed parallel beta-helix repeat-containing protein [Planctomycetes bacterium]|nr:right-handed parallel beta-helix repeat-containing protein [Planctomycetota bacterium]
MRVRACPILLVLSSLCVCSARAENASKPHGDPQLDAPTLLSLGAWWIVEGDDNRNAAVACAYRKTGETDWHKGPPLFRVEKGAHKGVEKEKNEQTKTAVPENAWLFAGSLLLLQPDTEYEWKFTLKDPDGGDTEKTLKARTIAEPIAPADLKVLHVGPGSGGGTGTKDDPFKGLNAAQDAAAPGTLLLVHAGVYEAPFEVKKSGEPGKPIVWRGAGDGETIIDGKGAGEKHAGRGISASDTHDVWFEKLTIRNADYGFVGHDSARLVVRRCHFHDVEYGLTWTRNSKDQTNGFFVCDNVIEGPSTWPRTKGIENARGIQATGQGHVICYNRIRAFADAMDTFGSQRCMAMDFHNNEISECTDDGEEMDYSERNTRTFHNRFTNVYQGISVQPVYGGPVYIFRNAVYNVVVEPFKVHNSPSGALMFHNSFVKKGEPLMVWTAERFHNCWYRNNLFIGSSGRAFDCSPMNVDCDFDYDGFGGFSGEVFIKWNNVKYATPEEIRTKGPVYKHVVVVDPATAFASGAKPPDEPKQQQDLKLNDLRLKEGSAAIDAGEALPGMNDGFAGKAPDLGAYELGEALPHYGPRPEK